MKGKAKERYKISSIEKGVEMFTRGDCRQRLTRKRKVKGKRAMERK